MKIIPLNLKKANNFVLLHHRHNKPIDSRAHKFSIGLLDDEGNLVGVGISGRPISRMLDNGKTLEVLRVCVIEGNKNANSKIYSQIKRIAVLMGYEKVITYTLQSESSSSLKAVSAMKEKELNNPQMWGRDKRPRKDQDVFMMKKIRWSI